MDKPKSNKRVIFRCPNCLNQLIDVPLDKDENGTYRCMKCGYNSNFDELMHAYNEFKSKYKLANQRITLEDQRKM